MTVNSPNFQLNKLRRIINTQGQDFVFTRETLDEFKEPTGEVQEFLIKGIYHEHYENLFLRQSTTDATVVRSKPSPKITCLWADASVLKNTDTVVVNGLTMKIGDIKNVGEADVAAAISLEVIEVGQ